MPVLGRMKVHKDPSLCVDSSSNLCCSPRSNPWIKLLSCGLDGVLAQSDLDRWEPMLRSNRGAPCRQGFSSFAYSEFGSYFATAGLDHVVRLWTLDSMFQIQSLTGHKAPIVDVVANDEIYQLVSASQDQVRCSSNGYIATCHAHNAPQRGAQTDTRHLVLTSPQVLKVWDVRTMRPLQVKNIHKDPRPAVWCDLL